MNSRFQKGMFIYPWDIAAAGVEQVIHDFQAAGCNTIAVNSSYHQGRFLHPLKPSFYSIHQSAISFEPELARYGRLHPLVHEDIAKKQILQKTRAAAEQAGIDFVTWWVGLHNSSLGRQNPDLCVQNVWDDRYTYSLCPSQPDVRLYAAALFEDTLASVKPKRIITESAAFLPMLHGEHHEVILLNISRTAEWLLSLCFCDSCRQNAFKRGIDVLQVIRIVQKLVEDRIEYDLEPLQEEPFDLPHLLLEYPELYNYQLARMNSVTQLVWDLSDIAKQYKVAFDYIPSAVPFPANQAFIEGVSLRQIAGLIDRFIPLAYGNAESAQHTLRTVSGYASGRAIGAALSLHYRINSSRESLLQQVQAVVESGTEAVFYYNYGLMNRRRLSWIKEANAYADEMTQAKENGGFSCI